MSQSLLYLIKRGRHYYIRIVNFLGKKFNADCLRSHCLKKNAQYILFLFLTAEMDVVYAVCVTFMCMQYVPYLCVCSMCHIYVNVDCIRYMCTQYVLHLCICSVHIYVYIVHRFMYMQCIHLCVCSVYIYLYVVYTFMCMQNKSNVTRDRSIP